MLVPRRAVYLALLLLITPTVTFAEEPAAAVDTARATAAGPAAKTVYATALIPFTGRGAKEQEYAEASTDIMYEQLSRLNTLRLVDREQIESLFSEQATSMSGLTAEDEAVKVAQLAGAKFYLFGRVVRVASDNTMITIKLVSVETSKLTAFKESIGADGELPGAVTKLARRIEEFIGTKAATLLPRTREQADPVTELLDSLQGMKLPGIYIKVNETHHESRTSDPASEMKILSLMKAAGCQIFTQDPGASANTEKADLIVHVEAVSSDLARRGELRSCAGRVEIKVIDPVSGKIIAAGDEENRAVDVSVFQAAKAALSRATEKLSLRIIPEFVRRWNASHPAPAPAPVAASGASTETPQ